MTKERREELREICEFVIQQTTRYASITLTHKRTPRIVELPIADILALLDSDERLERARAWLFAPTLDRCGEDIDLVPLASILQLNALKTLANEPEKD